MGTHDIRSVIDEMGREPMPASMVDVKRALRDGRRIRRTRRLVSAGTVAAVVALAVSGANLLGHRAEPVSVGSAPRSFDPLVRYAGFGWLPAKLSRRTTLTGVDHLTLEAGIADPSRSLTDAPELSARIFPAGRPLPKDIDQGPPWASASACPAGGRTERAPAVRGRSASWVYSRDVIGSHCRLTVVQLRWQYAPGAWAVIRIGDLSSVKGDRRDLLRRVAQTLRFGINEPVRMPFQAGYVPKGQHVTGTYEAEEPPDSGRWLTGLLLSPRARTWAPDRTANTTQPSVVITLFPMVPGRRSPNLTPDTTVDGHPAYTSTANYPLGVTLHLLSVYGVQGFEVDIQTSVGATSTPVRILRGLRLLGPDRAAWTTRPLP
ncbi:MAG: hypothetical protein ACRDP6_03440 [Actinoallomurus sp.]